MRKNLLKLLIGIFFITAANTLSFAVSANPNIIKVKQPDGSKIEIVNRGDEFYCWTEDKNGYTVIRDTVTNVWSYAQKDNTGKLQPSKNIVGKTNPIKINLQKSLKDDDGLYKANAQRVNFNKQIKNSFETQKNLSLSKQKNVSLSSPLKADSIVPISGKKTNFVLLVQFRDLKFKDNPPFKSSSESAIREGFSDLFNKTRYTKDGAVGSVKDYFKEVSYGKLEYNSVISPIITINESYTYYAYYNGEQTSFERTREMIKQALKQLHDSGYNFKDVWPDATEPEGFTIVHAGGGHENGNSSFIHSHKWEFETPVTYDGIKFKNYHVDPAGRGYYGNEGLVRIGTICHESIHFFGIPDLYDTTYISEGLGSFCIMASGSWNGNDGKCPAHPCAWVKYKLGWSEPQEATEGVNYIYETASRSDACYKLAPSSFSSKEYFLIENKQSVGFDKCLPGTKRGLLIYHVDEKQFDNETYNDDYRHYMVDVEEADGTSDWKQDHLAKGVNKGLDSDYYRNGTVTVFNDSCTRSPNSKSYSGTSSGINIFDISASASTMYFYLPEEISFDKFVDNLNSGGLALVNLIMKYSPAKTIEELRNITTIQQNKLAQYFTLSASGAKEANNMSEVYFDYVDNGLVYNIAKDKTGLVSYVWAKFIIKLNSILEASGQDIVSVGNVSEQNDSPLNNITASALKSPMSPLLAKSSVSMTSKRFTGTDAVESIKIYVKDLGCLIPTFSSMKYKTGYDIFEVTKETNIDDYPNYSLVRGANSVYFDNLSAVTTYPNPARNGVVNFINLPSQSAKLDIEIYTITGQFVNSFHSDDTTIITNGNRKLAWNCKNYSGSPVAPGVYIALIKTNSDKKKVKFAIVR